MCKINAAYRNMQVTAKGVLRGEFIALNDYFRNKESCHINNLSSYLRLEKSRLNSASENGSNY